MEAVVMNHAELFYLPKRCGNSSFWDLLAGAARAQQRISSKVKVSQLQMRGAFRAIAYARKRDARAGAGVKAEGAGEDV